MDGSYSWINDILPRLTAADAIRVDSGTGFPTVRLLKHFKLGRDSDAPTTWKDDRLCLTFDPGKTIQYRTGGTLPYVTELGSLVGSAARKGVTLLFSNTSGTATMQPRGTFHLYGCTFAAFVAGGSFNCTFLNLASGSVAYDTDFDGFSLYTFPSAGNGSWDVAHRVRFANLDATQLLSGFSGVDVEAPIFVGNPNPAYIVSGVSGLMMKDARFIGTPAVSDLRWSQVAAANWQLVRPTFSGNAARFSCPAGFGPPLSSATIEQWLANIVVIGDGIFLANIPVKLTDIVGTVWGEYATDANGRISFGSGIGRNAITVRDHYALGNTTYTVRDRSPMILAVNTGTNRDPRYPSRYINMPWPLDEDGLFTDLSTLVPLVWASGQPTVFKECMTN